MREEAPIFALQDIRQARSGGPKPVGPSEISLYRTQGKGWPVATSTLPTKTAGDWWYRTQSQGYPGAALRRQNLVQTPAGCSPTTRGG